MGRAYEWFLGRPQGIALVAFFPLANKNLMAYTYSKATLQCITFLLDKGPDYARYYPSA